MYKVGMGHKPQIPEKLSTEGKDFLGHCLESEPKRRWTASMLLDHTFVKVRDAVGLRSRRVFRSPKASGIEAAVFSPAGVHRRRVNGPPRRVFSGLQMEALLYALSARDEQSVDAGGTDG